MKTNTNKATHSEPNHTTQPCIFNQTDRRRLKKLLSKDSFEELMQLVAGDPMPLPLISSDGREINSGSMDEISIKSWHDGNEEYIYQIGTEVYANMELTGELLVYVERSVYAVIDYNYSFEEGYCEEKCVYFKIKPPLIPAKRGDDSLCRVWINTFYRDDHTRAGDHSGWVRSEDGKIIWFDSYSAARKWINQNRKEHHGYADIRYPKGHYLYSHNEYAPRKYVICE